MRWAGEGSELWFVRVEVFRAKSIRSWGGKRRQSEVFARLTTCLDHDDGAPTTHAVDEGAEYPPREVFGLTFSVRADDPGTAARTAYETASKATDGLADGLYAISLFPASGESEARPKDGGYPPLLD